MYGLFCAELTFHFSPEDAEALVDELAQSTPEAIKKMRSSTRLSIRAKVVVEPGSMSQRGGVKFNGVTGDVSTGGTQILVPRPLLIGDIYLLTFDRQTLDIAPAFALCLRGRQVRPDAFEAGLRFLEPITLPQSNEEGSRTLI